MNSKNAPRILTSVVILCTSACTGGAHVSSPPPPPKPEPQACATYGGFTVALAEATVMCTETIGPDSFTIDKSGRLQRKFERCTAGSGTDQEANFQRVNRLLALQEKDGHPRLQECLTERYLRWSELFKRTKLQACPEWKDPKVIAEGDRKTALQLSKMQPQLPYLPLKAGARAPQPMKRSTEESYMDLQVPVKSSIVFRIDYPKDDGACDDPAVCAAQCAAFLPGFVVSAAGHELVADPVSWYRDRTTNTCSTTNTDDPWCPPFVHGMAITITSPDSTVPAGDLYGHPNRGGMGERCVRWMPDAEGGPGSNFITDLNLQCTAPDDCLSKCGN